MLRTKDLTRTFGGGDALVRAVDGVSLEIHEGELVLIMGPSGSGKTTLLTMLGGLLRPTSGSIEIEGHDITRMSSSDLTELRRHLVGFIFQSFNLWESLSVLENVELALNIAGVKGRAARERARQLLDDRGLGPRAGFRSRDLSGGEKQRLSIARALANNPRIVLADEPTANLDSYHGRDIMKLLRDVAKSGGKAVLVVSHDQRIREVADRVLWLEDGRLKDMSRLVVDPVCGMSIGEDTPHTLTHNARRFFFCSSGCQREFAESPAKFLARPESEPGSRHSGSPRAGPGRG
jgi:putative ABC transport system ATP-binding protein